jgi:phage terminase large subunit-like protein
MWYTWGLRWCPEDSISYRTERGTVPYASWVESGLLCHTTGNRVDYSVVEQDILDLNKRFHIKQIAYDRWNAIDLVNRLMDKNLPMIEFVQGPKSYHPAMQALEIAYMGGKLAHGGDPLLAWCAANLVARYDQNLNMAPDKKKSADKIDDMCALLMAAGIAISGTVNEPEYKIFFI